MKILLSWLKDYIDIDETPEKIAEALTMAGLEVEEIIEPGKNLQNIVVGKILSKDPHPNADKLTVCKVDINKGEPLQIVCGASNMKAGDKVPVATIGTKMPDGFMIAPAKIRSVESYGMMCSKKELGLAEDHSGLYILPEDSKVGEEIAKTLQLNEVIFDINITPDRGDALSHLGVARDLSAIFNLPLKRDTLGDASGEGNILDEVKIEIQNNELCPRYSARLIKDVQVGESPEWLKHRLTQVGLRPLNNIVDITNYIMYDIGHPMHAFDFDKISGNKIIVKAAKEGEKFTTLDGIERTLSNSMIVIADEQKTLALGGVMGGLESSVTEETKTVLLEGACFNEVAVRKTAKALSLPSDSSARFERGVNIDNTVISLNEAVKLMKSFCKCTPVQGIADAYNMPVPLRQIRVSVKNVNRLIGINLSAERIETYLLRLKLEISKDEDGLIVSVPPYRHDLQQEADIIEEVARIYGYDNIPETLPEIRTTVVPQEKDALLADKIKNYLVSCGFHETITYSFIPEKTPDCFLSKRPIAIKNALSEEMKLMRTNLVPSMFEAIKRNMLNDEKNLKFFEVGKAYLPSDSNQITEPLRLCIGLAGAKNHLNWKDSKSEYDFHDLKGLIENIGAICGVKFWITGGETASMYHPSKQAEIRAGKHVVGTFGVIHPSLITNKKVSKNILIAEIDLTAISKENPAKIKIKEISEFPSVDRDLAITVPDNIEHKDILKTLKADAGNLLETCDLFDVYSGKGIEPGHKSLAYSLRFRDKTKTLTDEAINPIMERIIKSLEQKYQAKLR
ncbi:MAG: phenylalanine--tRNA ligase subunit beta [Candidatus Riflebacteria bacterium]|nr:phenylalanine--tRNA ligase subunit beta [Candidatus Riflebacteria bacterium]